MLDDGHPLQQQPQSLPMDGGSYLCRHPGKSQQGPVQLSSRPLSPLQLQRGIEDLPPVLITNALTDQPIAGRRECPIVFVTQLQDCLLYTSDAADE